MMNKDMIEELRLIMINDEHFYNKIWLGLELEISERKELSNRLNYLFSDKEISKDFNDSLEVVLNEMYEDILPF